MRVLRFAAAVLISGALVWTALGVSSAHADRVAIAACSPSVAVLRSPRAGSREVQAKAVNDRGDIVGFADAKDGTYRAILWKGGKAAAATVIGVLPGYVHSEAYGVNNARVVYGLLYDRQKRTFPFRWQAGRMTLLKGPDGQLRPTDVHERNTVNERGQIVGTLIVAGQRQAVRWSADGKAIRLRPLPGHTWTNAFSINDAGIVSGWSRKLPNEDGAENPVLWDAAGKVVPLKTAPGRFDGIAEATNRSGLTVGYLGNQSDIVPERDEFYVWRSRTAAPRRLGPPAADWHIAELADVNDRGQAIGTTGKQEKNGFHSAEPWIWQTGWAAPKPLPIPAAARQNPVLVVPLHDVNSRGDVVGNVYGLTGKAYDKLRRIDPVIWRCAFGR